MEAKNLDLVLFPKIVNVFDDPSLEIYFKPLLSVKKHVLGKEYIIHLLSTNGIFLYPNEDKKALSFKYINGKYHFLDNIKKFGKSNFSELYLVLKKDFKDNKEKYFEEKLSYKEYYKRNKELIKNTARFTVDQDPQYFAEAFYSYEFTKYYYEKTGELFNINLDFVDDGKKNILLSPEEVAGIINSFFGDLNKNICDISPSMAVCAIEGKIFSCWGALVVAFVNVAEDIIYIVEIGY